MIGAELHKLAFVYGAYIAFTGNFKNDKNKKEVSKSVQEIKTLIQKGDFHQANQKIDILIDFLSSTHLELENLKTDWQNYSSDPLVFK